MRRYTLALAALPLLASFCAAGAGVASAATPAPGPAPAVAGASQTALALTAPTVAFGDEQGETLTVTVSGAAGTPTGTVAISDGTDTVCTIALASGTGNCAPTAEEFPIGQVMLTATYAGDGDFLSSVSPAVSLEVTSPAPAPPPATTTTMQLSKAAVSYGDEQAETISVTVAAPGDGGATPGGTVTVSAGTAAICTIGLAAGAGSCVLKATALPPGTAKLTAAYPGDASFAASASAVAPLTVAKEPTATAVALSAAKVSYGAEQHEHISVTVKPAFGGTPTGHVTVKSGGKTIRVIALSAGKGGYTLSAASLAGGTVTLTASYSGDADFAGSTSAAKKLAIARESSKTALLLSAAKVSYGAEHRERFSVAVRPALGGIPAGHVTVRAGKTTLCVITLKSAKGACAPAATRLAAGRYKITASYSGSGGVNPSASAAKTLSIVKAAATTTLTLSKAKVTYGSEGAEKISVRVAPQYAGMPGGTVTVRANGSTLAVIKLKSGTGSLTLSAKRLAAGQYKLVASYAGSANFGSATSAKKSLTVASPPPPKPACYPLSNEGTCYEPGEFCRTADHGKTGIAGDGERIICEDNNGWRWEPY
ncbi:Ig-like domain repeat protein [Trebonia kvetii]|uniref:Ig-like domain repeat protein n=1 Tax=Trebonia kvetii TaxID=2480626 RepID=A0A6P2C179_9ACTN|nr:Ig-like domain-containing protein [Trebonia kvetii]TVZ04236.1 Ig-like domain repeat protein [Trebonia kvetii]